jgi:hypothetical protein
VPDNNAGLYFTKLPEVNSGLILEVRMKKSNFVICILFAICISVNFCYSQNFPQDSVITIILDNGQEFKGKVIKQDESVLLLETIDSERYTISKKDIKGVSTNALLKRDIQEGKGKKEDVNAVLTDENAKDHESMKSSGAMTPRPYFLKNKISLSYSHLSFARTSNISTLSGIYELSGNFRLGKTTRFVAGLPYSTFSASDSYTNSSESISTIGNIYLGFDFLLGSNLNSTFSAGLYLPTIDEDKALMEPAVADYPNFGKYIPNAISPVINYAFRSSSHPQLYYGFDAGLLGLIPTSKSNADGEAFFNYKLLGGLENPNLGFSVGFLGVMIITEEVDEFTDRFLNYLNVEFHYNGKGWQPQILYQKPLKDEISKYIEGMIVFRVNLFL